MEGWKAEASDVSEVWKEVCSGHELIRRSIFQMLLRTQGWQGRRVLSWMGTRQGRMHLPATTMRQPAGPMTQRCSSSRIAASVYVPHRNPTIL